MELHTSSRDAIQCPGGHAIPTVRFPRRRQRLYIFLGINYYLTASLPPGR